MFRNKFGMIKKGYALVYTLLFCSICMIIIAFIFTMELRSAKNTFSYKNYSLRQSDYEDLREILFTKLYNSVHSNVTVLNTDNVKAYFINSRLYFRTSDNKGCVKYDSTLNKIVYESVYEIGYYRKDLYDYKVSENKLKLIFIKAAYVKGAIE